MGVKSIEVGTRVVYSRNFLRSVGAYTGFMPFARGAVVDFTHKSPDFTIVQVEWDGPPGSECWSNVNIKNLIREDRRHLEPV